MTPIKLDLRTDLIKVIPTKLGDRHACRYSSPCAVGAMMTPDQRQQLVDLQKDTVGVDFLIATGGVTVPDDQVEDITRLQRAFDHGLPGAFEAITAELKEKYTL